MNPAKPQPDRLVATRLMAREQLTTEPAYVGLLAPSMQTGVHIHSAPAPRIRDLDDDSLLDFLAFKLFSGAGPHGIFMKTWASGLAYSNGLRSSAIEGRNHYYAERTPLLPQTLRFVINELKSAPRNKPLAEYTLAQVFSGTRSGSGFESRTASHAADLADGVGPDVIRAFRERILALRAHPNLDAELYARVDRLYARVLPGYDPSQPPVPGATYFVIGAQKQLSAWQDYLGQNVCALHPRDYWLIL